MASELASGFATVGESDWRALASQALNGASLDSLSSETLDGIRLAPVQPGRRTAAPLFGRPAGQAWRITERIDDPDPERANRLALDALANGATALSLVVRGAPSAHGYGIADKGDAVEQTLRGIDLDGVPLRIEPRPGAAETAAALADLMVGRGNAEALDISFGLDPIGGIARYGGLVRPWEDIEGAMQALHDGLSGRGLAGYLAEADGRIYHDAGASNAQELAAVLATALSYLRILSADRPLEKAAAAIGFTLAVDQVPLEGIAKLRALRLLWQRVLQVLGVEETAPARIHAETSWRMMTASDPHTNMLRTVIGGFSAGVGGADSLAILPYSAALGLPDGNARRLARNAQHVLVEESHLHRFADPAAGAGALEALTDGLCEAAWGLFQTIEADGGIVDSLATGRLQEQIARTAARVRDGIAGGERTIIGVTAHSDPAPGEIMLTRAEPWPTVQSDAPALRFRALTPVRWEEWVERG